MMKPIYLSGSRLKHLLFVLVSLFSLTTTAQRTFVHPGLAHKQSDLDRMRTMVNAKIEPWYTSYTNLTKEAGAKYNYSVRGNKSITKVVQDGENYSAITSDVRASYLNALMWVVTGDERHAQKAVEIFNAWQNLTYFQSGSTRSLEAGRVAWIWIEAAEIIKSTYTGWAADDIQKFKDMLVYPGYSTTTLPSGTTTFYWDVYMGDSGRHGNQDLFGWRVVMAMGVFLDNEIMYDRGYRYFTNQKSRDDDFDYEPGPPVTSTSPTATNEFFDTYTRNGQSNEVKDYGYNGVLPYFIWENGQCQESSRDQDHASLGLGLIASMAEIAWNQGDDIYSMFDNRILTGYEWALRYNVSYNYSFPDQPTPWAASSYTQNEGEATLENGMFIQRRDRSGRWFSKKENPHYESNFVNISRGNFKADKRPVYELAYAHYKMRMGLNDESIKWTKRARDISNEETGYEKSGWSLDHLGWGALTCRRTEWMAGDPVSLASGQRVFAMPEIPCTVNAVDFDYFVGNGQGRTYNDLTPANSGNVYRSDEAVDIIQDDAYYVISDMEQGEWMSYTIANPLNSICKVSVRHKTTKAGATLKIVIDNEQELEATLPVTSGYEEFELGNLLLKAGCKVFRVCTTGESNATTLSKLIVARDDSAQGIIELEGELTISKTAGLQWNYWSVVPAKVSIYRGTTDNFVEASLLVTDLEDNLYTDESLLSTQPQYFYWVVNEGSGDRVVSNPLQLSWGYFFDKFTDSASLWRVSTGTAEIVDDELSLAYGTGNMAITARSGGVILHAGNYPILAVKAYLPQDVEMRIYNASSSMLGGGANAYTGNIGRQIYYYDLTQVGFVERGTTTMVPTDDILVNNTFNLRFTALADDAEPVHLGWIGSFESLDKLNEYVVTSIDDKAVVSSSILNYCVDGKQVLFTQLPPNTALNAYSISGQWVASSQEATIHLPSGGIYIITINTDSGNYRVKVMVR